MNLITIRTMDAEGRICIPYEIRKALKMIGEIDFTVDAREGEILLRKCRPYTSIQEHATELLHTLYTVVPCGAMICDSHQVIASKGVFMPDAAPISSTLTAYVQEGKDYVFQASEVIYAVERVKDPIAAIFHIPSQDTAKPSLSLVLFRKRNKELTDMDLGSARLVAATLKNKLSK